MQHGRSQRLGACLLILSVSAAAETVILRNGFRLEAEHCEWGSNSVRLLTSNGGWIDVQLGDVARIEPDPVRHSALPEGEEPGPGRQLPPGLHGEIERIAAEAGIPGDLVRAVAWAESGLRQDAISPAGAVGLMQLMPETAAELGVDPRDSAGNLAGGALYLKQMLQRFAGDGDQIVKALAAYNAGPGRVAAHGGMPPYPETIAYVGRVVRRYLDSNRSDTQEPADGVAAAGPNRPIN